MEAAVHESPRRDRSLIVTGLEMFEREADGSLAGHTEPLFWTELPEFGHLQRYKAGDTVPSDDGRGERATLRDKLGILDKEGMNKALTESFLAFLSRLLGFGADTFDPQQMLTMYGMDSLNGVACQYWFHKGEWPLYYSRSAVIWIIRETDADSSSRARSRCPSHEDTRWRFDRRDCGARCQGLFRQVISSGPILHCCGDLQQSSHSTGSNS